MNFKIAFAFLGILTLEFLVSFLLALNYNCVFNFDYVCYNVLETCKNFMTLLNYTLIGSCIINYIINDIAEDEDLKEIICDVKKKYLTTLGRYAIMPKVKENALTRGGSYGRI